MPALDLLLPLLIGFIILFYVLILSYLFHLWRGEKNLSQHVSLLEQKMTQSFESEMQQSSQHILQLFEQSSSTATQQIQAILQTYQDHLLSSARDGSIQQQEASKVFSQNISAVLESFKQEMTILKQGVESELRSAIQDRVKDLYDTHKHYLEVLSNDYAHDLQTYKQQAMSRSEQLVREYSLRVLHEVFSDSMHDADHERLFMNALERAKREGLFNGANV